MHPSWFEIVNAQSRKAGFLEVGGFDYVPKARQLLEPHFKRYENWIELGYFAKMQYLVRSLEIKKSPEKYFPGLKSVICFLYPYSAHSMPSDGPKVARYLRDDDYHETIKAKLKPIFEAASAGIPDFKFKIAVDTSPVLERSMAFLAGLGWIGKNSMLIHPIHGSYTFISCVLVNQLIDQDPSPMKDLCGHCTKCLESCPTRALISPGVLDANRCISALTLEVRGEWSVDEPLKREMGAWIAGCDVCQECCPFNTKRSRYEAAPNENSKWTMKLEDLQALSENDYVQWVRGGAISRIKFQDFRRNLNNAILNLKSKS